MLKVNRFDQRERLGATSKVPRWVIAYKFEKYEATTRVDGIRVQVGKTGAITPVADLEPVEIAGTTVSRASLHNAEEIDRKDVRPGDVVVVEKAGKIIPHVVRVETTERQGNPPKFIFPSECPECGAKLVKDEGGVYIRCPNPRVPGPDQGTHPLLCQPQRDGHRRAGRQARGSARGQGPGAWLRRLVPPSRDALVKLKRIDTWGRKLSEKIVAEIEKSTNRGFATLLYALGLPRVNGPTAAALAEHFRDMAALLAADIKDIARVDRMGAIDAAILHECLNSDFMRRSIVELRSTGVRVDGRPSEEESEQLREKTPALQLNDCSGAHVRSEFGGTQA